MTVQLNPVEMLLKRAKSTPNLPYLHQPIAGQWKSYTWAQAADGAQRMASALQSLGLPPGSRVGITGQNTAHWFMADFACAMAGYVTVGLYPKQSDEATRYIIQHSDMQAIFIGPMPDPEEFMALVPDSVRKIAFPYPEVPACEMNWDTLVTQHPPLAEPVKRTADDMWTLIYTSGTTGQPKGVVITTENLVFPATGMMREMPPRPDGEVFLSYLPLAHAFERGAVLAASVYLCAQVYFLEAVEKLSETLRYVRPTRFYGVPLVWSRIQSGILKMMPQSQLDRMLSIPILSWYVKRKLRKGLGLDRCTYRISGAAPLPIPVMQWFAKLDMEIYQGYGMTENSIYVSVNKPGSNRVGSVGKPFVDSLIRIAEDGEIQNKHAGVTMGYFKDPERSAELRTADGWLRTGDKGKLDEDGYLYITGRVKEIFKTLKGKYVAPGPIEGGFASNTDVDQSCLVGSGMHQPILLVCLSPDARKKPRDVVEAGLKATMKSVNATLEPHEAIAKVIVTSPMWTIENQLMTPTMKVRRNEVEKQFGPLIARYEGKREIKVAWDEH